MAAFRDSIDGAIDELSAELVVIQRSVTQRRAWAKALAAATACSADSDRLIAVLDVAAREVPFYRRRLGGPHVGTPPLSAFPVLTKSELRAHFADLIRRDSFRHSLPKATYYVVQTSGSTGQPACGDDARASPPGPAAGRPE